MQPTLDQVKAVSSVLTWPTLALIVILLVLFIIPLYKSQGIWPFNKKKKEIPENLESGILDVRDRIIIVDTKVDNVGNSLGTFRDSICTLTGQVKEMVQTIKEEI